MKDFLLNIRYLLSYLLVASIMKFIKIMPRKFVISTAGAIAGLVYKFKFIHRLIQANLAAALPELSLAEREDIGRASMRNVVINMIEFIWLSGNPKRIRQIYQLPEEVCAQLKQFVADEVRIIFVNPHLGSWEASGVMAPFYAGVKMCAIAKPLRNPYLNRLLNQGNREKTGDLEIIFTKGAMRAATKALHRGLGLGTLIDQNTRGRDGGEFVNFFGLPVACSKAPATMMRYCRQNNLKSVIVYGTSIREEDGKIRARMELLPKPFEKYENDEAVIQDIMNISEKYIRRYPEQYLWLYKRFLYIPKDIDPELKKRYPYYAKTMSDTYYSKKRFAVGK